MLLKQTVEGLLITNGFLCDCGGLHGISFGRDSGFNRLDWMSSNLAKCFQQQVCSETAPLSGGMYKPAER